MTDSENMDWFLDGTTAVMTEEQAQEEVLNWLNSRKMSRRKRINLKDMIVNVMQAMVDGEVSILDGRFVQHLDADNSLKFNDRLNLGEFKQVCNRNKISDEDGDGRLAAATSVLTNISMAESKKLEGDAKALANSIALFFM
jgi:hypothetical protein